MSLIIVIIVACVLLSTSTDGLNLGQLFNKKIDIVDKLSGGSKSSNQKINSVAITGSTGLVGSFLKKRLESKNIRVISITSNKASQNKPDTIVWDIKSKTISDVKLLEGVDAVVHLAGEGIASGEGPLAVLGRWSDSKKDKILTSRVQGTKLIVETISKLSKKPKVFISASGIGYYPYTDDSTIYTETSETGDGFLAQVCREWENEAKMAEKYGVRTVCTRFGIILSSKGGLLAKLRPLFTIGGGGIIGSGKQGFSAVAVQDTVNAIEFILNDSSLKGPVNVCLPTPADNAEFTSAFGRVLSRPTIFPLPEIVAKLVFGQFGEELLIGGQKVVPTKLLKAGFKFQAENIKDAIKLSL